MSDELRLSYLAKRLSSGNATQQERDELLAIIAIAVQGVIDFEERVARIHTQLCEHCSVRQRISELEDRIEDDEIEAKANSRNSYLNSGKLPWLIILILVVILATLLGVDIKGLL